MVSLKRILESNVLVRYEDCDPFNHLNNSKYIDYIIAARTEQLLDNYEFNTAEIVKIQRIGWVASQTQISYLFPAVWLEKVIVETKLIAFSDSSLLVEAIMLNETKSHIKAIMWTKLVHFNIHTQRSLKHSEEFMNFFGSIVYPLEVNLSFDERVKNLKQLNQTS